MAYTMLTQLLSTNFSVPPIIYLHTDLKIIPEYQIFTDPPTYAPYTHL